MIRLLCITSSRADISILRPVWNALLRTGAVDLHVGITGMHCLSQDYAMSQISKGATVHSFGSDIGGLGGDAAVAAMSRIQEDSASLFGQISPDMILVTGDRLDMFPTAVAAIPFNIPLVHLHGGERTEGAVDDRVRHAMTKLAHLHCVSNADAAGRVAQMGESPEQIIVTGAPGLDTLLETEEVSREQWFQELTLTDNGPLRLVTVHPETNSENPNLPGHSVIEALRARPGPPTVVTAPNSDPGGVNLLVAVKSFCGAAPNTVFRETLGARLYVNSMRHAAVMIGNSSSGIIEAPILGLPVINVGDRQAGRVQGDNVLNCSANAAEISACLDWIVGGSSNPPAPSFPYGDGKAATRIANVVARIEDPSTLLRKTFAAPSTSFANPW